MRAKILRSEERGMANFGWLEAKYAFSFANYYNPEWVNFGALRVLNDDVIQGGAGFGEHPHDNMEIISIPLSGGLQHKDSMSNQWIPLKAGEVQVMSAGTGITHAEKNLNSHEALYLFQIWIIPNQMKHTPRYDQKAFNSAKRQNKLQLLVSSFDDADDGSLKINQDARISRIDLDEHSTFNYVPKSMYYGIYVMVINGSVQIGNDKLSTRDAIAISQTEQFEVITNSKTELLFIEVPMKF